jgi:hypothetical protein
VARGVREFSVRPSRDPYSTVPGHKSSGAGRQPAPFPSPGLMHLHQPDCKHITTESPSSPLTKGLEVLEVRSDLASRAGSDADGHQLSSPRSIVLDEADVFDVRVIQSGTKLFELVLVLTLESDRKLVGIVGKTDRRFSSGVDQHGCLDSLRKIRPSDAILGDRLLGGRGGR